MTTDDLEPYYTVDRHTLAGYEATSKAVTAMLAEMTDDDTAVLAQSSAPDGSVRYLPIILVRDDGLEAVVNMAIVEDEQRNALLHCVERLATFTRIAYDELGKPVPDELEAQTDRLHTAIEEDAFFTAEQFGALDAALFQLESILDEYHEASPVAPHLEGEDTLRGTLALAEQNFDLIRALVYFEDDSEE